MAAFPAGGTVELTANIDATAGEHLTVDSPVTLDLHGNTLTITNPANQNAAIEVARGKSLTIEDSTGTSGELVATGGSSAAGIGGNANSGAETVGSGTVTITSGTVDANGGGSEGAGIGGGYNGANGTVTISGGTVTATGGRIDGSAVATGAPAGRSRSAAAG